MVMATVNDITNYAAAAAVVAAFVVAIAAAADDDEDDDEVMMALNRKIFNFLPTFCFMYTCAYFLNYIHVY